MTTVILSETGGLGRKLEDIENDEELSRRIEKYLDKIDQTYHFGDNTVERDDEWKSVKNFENLYGKISTADERTKSGKKKKVQIILDHSPDDHVLPTKIDPAKTSFDEGTCLPKKPSKSCLNNPLLVGDRYPEENKLDHFFLSSTGVGYSTKKESLPTLKSKISLEPLDVGRGRERGAIGENALKRSSISASVPRINGDSFEPATNYLRRSTGGLTRSKTEEDRADKSPSATSGYKMSECHSRRNSNINNKDNNKDKNNDNNNNNDDEDNGNRNANNSFNTVSSKTNFDNVSRQLTKSSHVMLRHNKPAEALSGSYLKKTRQKISALKLEPKKAKSRKGRDQVWSKRTSRCLSRMQLPLNWKLARINEIEDELKQHPLALYPHLEEYIPSNIFEEVMEILDPEMRKALDEENCVDPERLNDFSDVFKFNPTLYGLEEEEEEVKRVDEDAGSKSVKELLYKLQKGLPTEVVNPYRHIFKYDEREKKAKEISRYSRSKYASIETNFESQTATKDFCQYLATLSQDEKSAVTEEDVAGYFANGFESKPPLSVPVQFIAMEGIPLELRRLTGGPDAVEMMKKQKVNCESLIKDQLKGKEAAKKFRFGAWYLEPKQWRKILVGEPLVDPKGSKDNNLLEANIKDLELDNQLASMHGTKLFLEFASRSKKRKPEFLKNVMRLMSENSGDDKLSKSSYPPPQAMSSRHI